MWASGTQSSAHFLTRNVGVAVVGDNVGSLLGFRVGGYFGVGFCVGFCDGFGVGFLVGLAPFVTGRTVTKRKKHIARRLNNSFEHFIFLQFLEGATKTRPKINNNNKKKLLN
jgi:hypothetical protein